jgi:hypothetical protein
MMTKITYIDSEQLEVQFSSCFFRVDRILALVESLERFQTIIDRPIRTNGKLVNIFEMRSPPNEIKEMIVHQLLPLGFEYKKDLIILEEQLIHGAGNRISPLLNQAIPESLEIDWLDSIITLNGNFVWWLD